MNKVIRLIRSIAMLVIAVVLLAACGGSNPTAVPAATNTTVAAAPASTSLAAAPTNSTAPSATQPVAAPTSDQPTEATPTSEAASTNATPNSAAVPEGQTGTILGDSGLRADKDGFSFRNFGNEYPNTPGTFSLDEARKLLGDTAICSRVENNNCTPSQAAQQWIDTMNKGINGGHCEGFAVASLQMYKGLLKPSDFGADSIANLQFDPSNPSASSPALRDLIAGDWVLQTMNPVQTGRDATFNLKPNEVLDKIIAGMQNGSPDPYTLSFWKPNFKAGHAVTPTWAEDRGNNIVWLHIYDNNYPKEDRYIVFDRAAQTWSYSTAADPRQDPSAYIGDATTLTLAITPLSLRTQKPVCPFCENPSGNGLLAPGGQQMEQVMLNGTAELVFTDKSGRKFGYQNGKYVSDIEGASRTLIPGGLGKDHSPIYNLPEGSDYQISLDSSDGADATSSEITMFGQGMAIDLSGVKLSEGGSDSLTISGDGQKFSYKSDDAETPEVKIASDSSGKDYGFTISGLDFSAGEQIDFSVDEATGRLAIKDESGEPDTYSLSFTAIDANGTQSYSNKDIEIKPGDTEYIDYAAWNDGSALNVEVDSGSDGSIDTTVSETDEQP